MTYIFKKQLCNTIATKRLPQWQKNHKKYISEPLKEAYTTQIQLK